MKTFVKNMLSENQVDRLRDARLMFRESRAVRMATSAQTGGLRVASSARPLSTAYYALLSRQFQREERAVLAGLAKYHAELQEDDANVFLMRRNVHRLEKGLSMRPRRPVFAKDYILETVNVYRKVVDAPERSAESSAESLHWAYDVLSEYFRVVAADPVLDHAREVFDKCPTPTGSGEAGERIPYKRNLDEHPVSFEQLEKLSIKRRSVRWFEQKPVPRDLLDKAFGIASLSPSACNRQPFRFIVFDDPEMIATAASLPGGTIGWKHQIPVMVAIIGSLDAFYSEKDRHVIYIDGALAAMSFSYALETLGLSSCICNWPDIESHERRAEKVLGLESYERPVMFMAVGSPDPDATVAYSQKRPLEVMRTYNPPLNNA